ncbi:MAG: GWxTD domain-containing protein [Candidatus Aminicenantes bacterium]|nr:GWxTD domain-containing protein [Candidatus Aminicenantes bacterium]
MTRINRGLVMAVVVLGAGCFLRPSLQSLDPESREFLSKVRYIIEKDEKAAFVGLKTAEERNAFIEDFWAKRDSDPETEVNEFKLEYSARVDAAAGLFKEGTTPGWLTERGRLYITLGPPDHRLSYPRGVTFYGKPTEIWYYNFFPVRFVDDNWTGTYRLDPDSAAQIGEITKTQVYLKPRAAAPASKLEDVPLEIKAVGPGEAVLRVTLLYKDIWLNAEGGVYNASLEIAADAVDNTGAAVWSEHQTHPLSLTEEEYLKRRGESLVIEIPVKLAPGEYGLTVVLTGLFPGARAEKKVKLLIE